VNNNPYLLVAAACLILLALRRAYLTRFSCSKDNLIAMMVCLSAFGELFMHRAVESMLAGSGPFTSLIPQLPAWICQAILAILYSTPLALLLAAIWLAHPQQQSSDE
jgi:hypothetical protein